MPRGRKGEQKGLACTRGEGSAGCRGHNLATQLLLPAPKLPRVPKGEDVEFVGPQQPNGEMAQWGNMAQRGNSPKGKVWVHTRK